MIIERNRISVMNEAVEQLNEIAQEWKSSNTPVVPEVDWSKMRQLEFQENLRSRNALVTRLEGKACILCQDLDDHVRILPMMLSLAIDSQKLR
jgi:antiviral helicase SKI2